MAIGHIANPRRFKPTGKGGGSKKGKPQSAWPVIFKVASSAVIDRAKGSHEARLEDRSTGLTESEFRQQMEIALPGCWDEAAKHMPGRSTSLSLLLMNRAYKGDIYSGSSDRRAPHDPRTRAAVPSESWRRRLPASHPLLKVYDDIRLGRTIANWKDYLEPQPGLFT